MDFHLEGNPYVPVDLGIANGVPQTLLAGTSGTSRATLDTGSPVSLLASEAGCDPATPLRVLGTLPPSPTRLVFADLHPACATGGLSLLGGDVLARYEVLFEHDSQTVAGGTCTMSAAGIELLPSEIESTTELGADGFSVISFHRTGGGKYVDVTGRTIEYVPTRAPLRVCINPPTDYHTAGGVDATLLVATGIAPLVLSANARARLLPEVPPGVAGQVLLPDSMTPIGAEMLTPLTRLAIVGQTIGSGNDPGPCAELRRDECLNDSARAATSRDCDLLALTPTVAQDDQSDAGAYLILEDLGVEPAAVIADETPYLVAARSEVRPTIADIDGFLGANLLCRLGELRIDYPGVPGDDVDSGSRFLSRCQSGVSAAACTQATRHRKAALP